MPNPISYRPSEATRRMLDEMMAWYNQDTPAILSRAIAELYRLYRREAQDQLPPPANAGSEHNPGR